MSKCLWPAAAAATQRANSYKNIKSPRYTGGLNDLNELQIDQTYQTRVKMTHSVPFHPKVGAKWLNVIFSDSV